MLLGATGLLLIFLPLVVHSLADANEMRKSLHATSHLVALMTSSSSSSSSSPCSSAVSTRQKAQEQHTRDLDAIAGTCIHRLWKTEIEDTKTRLVVLLTGATGYVGKAVLFHLLREIDRANSSSNKDNDTDGNATTLNHKILVTVRPKPWKKLSAAGRLAQIRDDSIFAPFQNGLWDNVVVAVEMGDLQDVPSNCGMSNATLLQLHEAQITHVIHCAADTNFNRPLAQAALINIAPALYLHSLAQTQWSTTVRRFVHCSTAFVHPGAGSKEKPLPEELVSLRHYDAQELYHSMVNDPEQKLALQAKQDLGFVNNYVFSKCVGEHLLTRQNNNNQQNHLNKKTNALQLDIVRPAIVGPAWALPKPGWNGHKPSTISGVFLLYWAGVIRCAPLIQKPLPVVPVDVVAVGILHAILVAPAAPQEGTRVRNLIWSHASPRKFGNGQQMVNFGVHAGLFIHHLSPTYFFLISGLSNLCWRHPALYDFFHAVFNLGPLYVLQGLRWLGKQLHVKSLLDKVPVDKLIHFSEILTQYKSFTTQEFYFVSSMDVPPSLDPEYYNACMLAATTDFYRKFLAGKSGNVQEDLNLLPRGRWDMWWALTQPFVCFHQRLAGYLGCQILRAACEQARLDFASLEYVFQNMKELLDTDGKEEKWPRVVLVPIHGCSTLDNILLQYISLYLGCFDIVVPGHLWSAGLPAKCELQLTSYLEKLRECSGSCPFKLVPIGISYNMNRSGGADDKQCYNNQGTSLVDMLSLYWNLCMLRQQQWSTTTTTTTNAASVKNVRVTFGVPYYMAADANLNDVARHLQEEKYRML